MDRDPLWDDVAGEPWVRYEDFIDQHSKPFEDAVLAALGPIEGVDVLDVGCGTGSSSLRLAQRGAATVLGVDLSSSMISRARARIDNGSHGAVRFEVSDASAIESPQGFDVIFSRFGVMFFSDAAVAFRSLHRMGRPGARLGFCAWSDPLSNPWMAVPIMASAPILGPPDLPSPNHPGPFSLAAQDRVQAVLTEAGWSSPMIEISSVERSFATRGAEATATAMIAINPLLAAGLNAAPEKADDLHAAVTAALADYEVDGEVRMPAAALIVTAQA